MKVAGRTWKMALLGGFFVNTKYSDSSITRFQNFLGIRRFVWNMTIMNGLLQ